jgi:lipopolysaccharide transport system ATP-binding protein
LSDIAFQVSNLSKSFKVWKRPSDMLIEALTGRRRHAEFRALDDISFDMPSGCVMGVLGRNGAGKSTLLRLIAGTLEPTSGRIQAGGRVAAILELGTGFHPEYSGRDNVLLGGLCLGLSAKEIERRFDEIVDFAELADVIDQPFRTYSSGMQARLTFAVATSVDADILIIDEALSVGDARFSLKSFDRIQQFRGQGKAILLVSHDINTVNSFCDQALLLEHGRLIASGEPKDVGNRYHELLFGAPQDAGTVATPLRVATADREGAAALVAPRPPVAPTPAPEDLPPLMFSPSDGPADAEDTTDAQHPKEHRYGDGQARITEFLIRDVRGRRTARLTSLEPYEFVIRVEASYDVHEICMGVLIRTSRGTELYGADSTRTRGIVPVLRAGEAVTYYVPFRNNLAPGVYFATASLARTDSLKHDLRFDALEFLVEGAPGVYASSLTNLEMTFDVGEVETVGAIMPVSAE